MHILYTTDLAIQTRYLWFSVDYLDKNRTFSEHPLVRIALSDYTQPTALIGG